MTSENRTNSLIEVVSGRIWCREYPVKVKSIMGIPARCSIVKLNNGHLWVHSPCPLDQQLKTEVNALGPVGYIIAPNNYHWFHIKAWQESYPNAKTYFAPELAARQQQLTSNFTLTNRPEEPWADELTEQLLVYSNPQQQRNRFAEVEFYDRLSKTLIVTDFIVNVSDNTPFINFPAKMVMKMMKGYGRAVIHREFKHVESVKAATDRMLELPLDRIIVNHGDVIHTDPKTVLQWATDAYMEQHTKK